MLIVQVKSQICSGISQYDRCSTNSACGCLHMIGAHNFGICGFLYNPCSEFVSCQSSNNACYEPNHVCVDHPRCHLHPVCYPMSMAHPQLCPSITSKKINSDLQIQLHLKLILKGDFFTVHIPVTYTISVGVRTVKKK